MRTKFILSVFFVTILTAVCYSAPPAPGGGGKPVCWPPPCVPIDGGISLLIIAGAIYGGKKLHSKSNNKKTLL